MLQRQKQHIREELSEAIKQRDALRNEQRALRDELSGSRTGVRTFDQVEPRLAELEVRGQAGLPVGVSAFPSVSS